MLHELLLALNGHHGQIFAMQNEKIKVSTQTSEKIAMRLSVSLCRAAAGVLAHASLPAGHAAFTVAAPMRDADHQWSSRPRH